MIYIINFSFYIISHKKKIKRKLIILNSPHLFIIIINNNIGVCYYCVNITMKCGIHETIGYGGLLLLLLLLLLNNNY
jgi:hypothetical protein